LPATDLIQRALSLPRGARFHLCALQVNPYAYLRRHHKETSFSTEAEYNRALVRACRERGIEAIGVTDHYRIETSRSLIAAAEAERIVVFPGFEAETKDGVHFLCLFPPGTTEQAVERAIGDCKVHDLDSPSPRGEYDCGELLRASRESWNALGIAAHVASEKGLLRALHGQARVSAWKDPHLLACSLPGPVADAPSDLRPILENRNADYRRERPVAVINAQDVNGPKDLEGPGTSCWLKMSEISIEGLRQAFLDPESRIRLASDPPPEEHLELVALAWEGGFLDGQALHFNENLNVLIGGRGAGKSAILESLRHVLDLEPLGEEAARNHRGIVKDVLRSGTRIALRVRSSRPSPADYEIERILPNPPVVRNGEGEILDLSPRELLVGIDFFGQHEISELTRSPEKLTRLLARFVEREPAPGAPKDALAEKLRTSRARLEEVARRLANAEERLARLPGLEESLRRFQEAGVEAQLQEQSQLVREEQVLTTTEQRLQPFEELLDTLVGELPIDRAFLSPAALEDLPHAELLREGEGVLANLEQALRGVEASLQEALATARKDLGGIRGRWEALRGEAQSRYEKILRDLHREKIDGAEFITLRRQIEALKPLKEEVEAAQARQRELLRERRSLVAEWEEAKAAEFRRLEKAAKKVSKKLAGHVRVAVHPAGDREPLATLFRERVPGRLAETLQALRGRDPFSLVDLAGHLRAGAGALMNEYGLTASQAHALAEAGATLPFLVEELDLPAVTTVELNVAGEGEEPAWKALDALSTGQKATAVLLLLLLESEAPLLIDQPEDDLDNRFITEVIVPKMREEKRRRQFLFATHNANIPVLGDAELIAGLRAAGEAEAGQAEIPAEHLGSIDNERVRLLVEELLEGGKTAFETRRQKYGF